MTRIAAKKRLPVRFPNVTAPSKSELRSTCQPREALTDKPVQRKTPPWNRASEKSHGECLDVTSSVILGQLLERLRLALTIILLVRSS